MNYETERKLNEKVDKWELHSLQSDNRELKNQIREIERKLENLESNNSNRYYALERLFNIFIEHPEFSELQNEMYELRGLL